MLVAGPVLGRTSGLYIHLSIYPFIQQRQRQRQKMDPLASGEHCDVRDCKQFDFLPFTCDRCRKVFCLSHRRYEDHDCSGGFSKGSIDRIVIVCPICAQSFPLEPNVDPNESFHQHQLSGSCNPENYRKVRTVVSMWLSPLLSSLLLRFVSFSSIKLAKGGGKLVWFTCFDSGA